VRKLLPMVVSCALLGGLAVPALASSPATKASVRDFAFKPGKITIKRGTKVTWRFVSGYHDVTVRSGPAKFTSGERRAPNSYSHVFTKAGTYRLYCKIHSWMKETVVVK
jgi:plastocyanin